MLSLGVSIAHDRGVALVQDGRVVSALSLERLDRRKHSSGVTLPEWAIKTCLSNVGADFCDIDAVVYNFPHHLAAYPVAKKIHNELNALFPKPSSPTFITHHLAHAYSTFYASPYHEAVVLIIDGAGNEFSGQAKKFFEECGDGTFSDNEKAIEAETGYMFSGEMKRTCFKRWQTREGDNQVISLGRMYWEACLRLGMGILDGGKLMGLSSYAKNLGEVLLGSGDMNTGFNIDLKALQNMEVGSFEKDVELAGAVQHTLEYFVLNLVRWLHNICGYENICLAGGVALNSVVNEKIIKETPFKRIFVTPASNDSGIPLGCAYYGYYNQLEGHTRAPYHPYLGKIYSRDCIMSALGGLEYRESEDVFKETAKFIADGAIVGWFQGGSEYGPRALGNRSILCDPRYSKMKDVLNNHVKRKQASQYILPRLMT